MQHSTTAEAKCGESEEKWEELATCEVDRDQAKALESWRRWQVPTSPKSASYSRGLE